MCLSMMNGVDHKTTAGTPQLSVYSSIVSATTTVCVLLGSWNAAHYGTLHV